MRGVLEVSQSNERESMTHLVKYNAARNALAEAHAIDEVKDIRDKAEAMAAYARQAKDTEMIQWVTEIKVRAERRAGQMLAEMPKAKGTQLNGKSIGGHIVVPPKNDEKTLADLGITKNESSRWQKLAGVSEEQFEHAIAAAKEVAGEVTTAAMLRSAKPENEKKEKKAPVVTINAPAYDPAEDEAKEKDETIRTLSEEVDSLKDRLAVEVMSASEEEKTTASETIKSLRAEVKRLEIENSALVASRDSYQRENGELKRQCAMYRKQIEKSQRIAA